MDLTEGGSFFSGGIIASIKATFKVAKKYISAFHLCWQSLKWKRSTTFNDIILYTSPQHYITNNF